MDLLTSDLPVLTFKKNEVLVRPEEPLDYLYVVERGFVRQYTISSEGQELTVYIYPKRSIFFMPWLLGVRRNEYFFEAVTLVKAFKIRIAEMREQMQKNGKLAYDLMDEGYTGLILLMIHMESMMYGNALSKVASVLAILVRAYGLAEGKSIRIELPLTHRLLATIVGMTRETTSTAVSELKRRGILKQRGKWMYVFGMADLDLLAAVDFTYYPDFNGIMLDR